MLVVFPYICSFIRGSVGSGDVLSVEIVLSILFTIKVSAKDNLDETKDDGNY
jgi:hypothetical protein